MIKIGSIVEIISDTPTVDGVLYKGSLVEVLSIGESLRVKDNLGKIWYIDSKNVTFVDNSR